METKTGLEMLQKLPNLTCSKCVYFDANKLKDIQGNLITDVGFCTRFTQSVKTDEKICHYHKIEVAPAPQPNLLRKDEYDKNQFYLFQNK